MVILAINPREIFAPPVVFLGINHSVGLTEFCIRRAYILCMQQGQFYFLVFSNAQGLKPKSRNFEGKKGFLRS